MMDEQIQEYNEVKETYPGETFYSKVYELLSKKINLGIFPAHELVLIFLVTFISLLGIYVITLTPPIIPITYNKEKVEETSTAFQNVSLSAKAAYVWDIENQKAIFSYNADKPLPLASLTKVMTAITAVDLIPKYTVITVEPEYLAEEGDSGLYGYEKWKLEDLLDYSLVVSSNDGARAIAAAAGSIDLGTSSQGIGRDGFISRMNEKAKEINLTRTKFSNENGLDINTERGGAYGSASDMARLFEYILGQYPTLIQATRQNSIEIISLSNILHKGKNTNTKVGEIPGLLASKTGFTELSGGNLVIAFNPSLNRPIIISVLGSTYDGRFDDVLTLVEATKLYIAEEK